MPVTVALVALKLWDDEGLAAAAIAKAKDNQVAALLYASQSHEYMFNEPAVIAAVEEIGYTMIPLELNKVCLKDEFERKDEKFLVYGLTSNKFLVEKKRPKKRLRSSSVSSFSRIQKIIRKHSGYDTDVDIDANRDGWIYTLAIADKFIVEDKTQKHPVWYLGLDSENKIDKSYAWMHSIEKVWHIQECGGDEDSGEEEGGEEKNEEEKNEEEEDREEEDREEDKYQQSHLLQLAEQGGTKEEKKEEVSRDLPAWHESICSVTPLGRILLFYAIDSATMTSTLPWMRRVRAFGKENNRKFKVAHNSPYMYLFFCATEDKQIMTLFTANLGYNEDSNESVWVLENGALHVDPHVSRMFVKLITKYLLDIEVYDKAEGKPFQCQVMTYVDRNDIRAIQSFVSNEYSDRLVDRNDIRAIQSFVSNKYSDRLVIDNSMKNKKNILSDKSDYTQRRYLLYETQPRREQVPEEER